MSKTVVTLIAVALVVGCAWFTLTDRLTGISPTTTQVWPPFPSVTSDKIGGKVSYFMAGGGGDDCVPLLALPIDMTYWGDEWRRQFPPVKEFYSPKYKPYKHFRRDNKVYLVSYGLAHHNGEWRAVPIDEKMAQNPDFWMLPEIRAPILNRATRSTKCSYEIKEQKEKDRERLREIENETPEQIKKDVGRDEFMYYYTHRNPSAKMPTGWQWHTQNIGR